jgi:hypothetical protein
VTPQQGGGDDNTTQEATTMLNLFEIARAKQTAGFWCSHCEAVVRADETHAQHMRRAHLDRG